MPDFPTSKVYRLLKAQIRWCTRKYLDGHQVLGLCLKLDHLAQDHDSPLHASAFWWHCYGPNVCVPILTSYVEALMWWYLEMGFWEVTKSWRWCPLMRLVSLWGKQGSQLSLLSIFWSYNKNMIIHISGYARTLILGFAGFRTMRNECLLLNPPIYNILL